MDYDNNNRLNLAHMFIMFFAIVLFSIPANIIYLYLIYVIPFPYLSIILAVSLGSLYAWLVKKLFHSLKITNKPIAFIFVVSALIVSTYFKWVFWVAYLSNYYYIDSFSFIGNYKDIIDMTGYLTLNPSSLFKNIVLFNQYGTWGLDDGDTVHGLSLLIVWIIELIIINMPPIKECFIRREVFISELDSWAKPAIIAIKYPSFNKYEIESLSEKNYDVILNKPSVINIHRKKSFVLAFLKVDDKFTGYIAIYKLTNLKHNIKEEVYGKEIFIGIDECIKLEKLFQDKFTNKLEENNNINKDNIEIENSTSNTNDDIIKDNDNID